MIEITTNINEKLIVLNQKIGELLDTERLTRSIATSMVPVMRNRVHEKGLAADGSNIGTYDFRYLLFRQRPPNNRTADPDVILSLTREMENDLKAVPIQNGWGIGYTNQKNLDKAIENEKRFGKKILTALTPEEDALIVELVDDYVNEIIDAIP